MIISFDGAFGGAWEDWCDDAIDNGRLEERHRSRCKSGGVCAVSPPYTAWGSTCRGIPYVGYDQGLLAKAAQVASAITTVQAAVLTAGLSTIPQGGPGGLIGTVVSGAQAAREAIADAQAAAANTAVTASVANEAPPHKPLMAGLGGFGAMSLVAGAVGLALVITASVTNTKRRAKR